MAIARVIGETAPLLRRGGPHARVINFNPFSGRMATLPVFAYNSYASPGARASRSSTGRGRPPSILMIIVVLLNLRRPRLVARRVRDTEDPLHGKAHRSPRCNIYYGSFLAVEGVKMIDLSDRSRR